METPLLAIKGLKTYFFTRLGQVKAVDDVNLKVYKGDKIGLVGESGCGKSTLGFSILRLIPPPGKIVEGEILFKGRNLLELSEQEMRIIRGGDISACFQDPLTYLNPVHRVGNQIAENIRLHQSNTIGEKTSTLNKKEAFQKAIEMMDLVGIPAAEKRAWDYPHQLSGGMRQRVLLAMAISSNPDLLILDEPTTAVDVIIQAQILLLIQDICDKLGSSFIFVTHDMGIVAQLTDKIAVMYSGNIVEFGKTQQVLYDPKHPYTEALVKAIPKIGIEDKELVPIEGEIPDPLNPPSGCKFHPRCSYVKPICLIERPINSTPSTGRTVMCHLY